jgi:hypothetical protein
MAPAADPNTENVYGGVPPDAVKSASYGTFVNAFDKDCGPTDIVGAAMEML